MSCNNYLSYYNNYCNPNPCQSTTVCQTVTTTTPTNVTYINGIASATVVISGGAPIPTGTVITPGTTTVPAGTVTVINGYTGIPSTNVGGITQNNGFFTVPVNGRYIIAANVCFATTSTVTTTDNRTLYIYRSDAITGVVTLLAVDSRAPILNSPTCINLTTIADLTCNDRIFVAATQLTSTGESVSTIAGTGRIAITRI